MYSMEDMTDRETCLTEVKKCHKSIERNFMMKTFLLFFVLRLRFEKILNKDKKDYRKQSSL